MSVYDKRCASNENYLNNNIWREALGKLTKSTNILDKNNLEHKVKNKMCCKYCYICAINFKKDLRKFQLYKKDLQDQNNHDGVSPRARHPEM